MATILLIEQDPNQRVLYRYELEDVGYELLLACCGSDAFGIIRQQRPDLILVNPNLPDMQLHVFMRLLKTVHDNLPVIAYSGDIEKESMCQDVVDAFLLKRSDMTPLKNKIASLLTKQGIYVNGSI